ncbi:MAG: thioredoxin-like negative regulator of GroEL [Planctomycetota bacterium]|jgi:thioredoxin-like negative regulator of GroEL
MKSQLEALANKRDNVRLRIVDIGSWDSAIAQQSRTRSLPSLWLFEDGELVSDDTSDVIGELSSRR